MESDRDVNGRIREDVLVQAALMEARPGTLMAGIGRFKSGAPTAAAARPPSAKAAFGGILQGQWLSRRADAVPGRRLPG